MGNRIIEIVELGKPQSIIQREGAPITELIHTHILIEELNEQLLLYNVVGQSQQRELLAFYLFIQENDKLIHNSVGHGELWIERFKKANCL